MYYRLKNDLRMRGWNLLETGLVSAKDNKVIFIRPDLYSLIRMCNGMLDSGSILFTDEQRKGLKALADLNIMDVSKDPLPLLTEEQNYKKYNNRYINFAHWSVTGKCNYRCLHCYMSAPHELFGEMTKEQCEDVIKQMAGCGVMRVSLTGGEALVHPHFWHIVDLLIENHIALQSVYSNGFLINEKFFENCEQRGIKPHISLSFDGIDGAHEWLRNIPGAQKHIEKAFKLCMEHGFKTDVEFCLNRHNAGQIRENMQYLQQMGCSAVKINGLNIIGEGKSLKDEEVSIEERYRLFMEYIPRYKEDGINMTIQMNRLFLTKDGCTVTASFGGKPENAEKYCLCGHARSSMYITSEGYVLPCIPYSQNPEVTGMFSTLFEHPLSEILDDSMYFSTITMTLADYLKNRPECAACDHRYKCTGGCRGAALSSAESADDFWAADRESCWIFKNHIDEEIRNISDRVFGKKSN